MHMLPKVKIDLAKYKFDIYNYYTILGAALPLNQLILKWAEFFHYGPNFILNSA